MHRLDTSDKKDVYNQLKTLFSNTMEHKTIPQTVTQKRVDAAPRKAENREQPRADWKTGVRKIGDRLETFIFPDRPLDQ